MLTTIGPDNWKWHQFEKNEIEKIKHVIHKEYCPFNKEWLDHIQEDKTNCLRTVILENGKKVVKGSLIYEQNFEDELDHKICHFFMTNDQLITVNLDLSSLKHISQELLFGQIEKTENAVDGFLTILGELMNEMLYGIDLFEEKLNELIWNVSKKNKTSILDKIYMRRHELLLWKNLSIPLKELKMGIEEIYFDEGINDKIIFNRTGKRIDRALVLINEYETEIDSIINLEEVISSHRGNEIMKTLTVMTTIFTPVMALGALWGMNFKNMPELEWKYGYLLSFVLIIVSTLALYGYLKMKGWTGDLLKGRKKGSFFK
ncbi:magnesium transporter CorA family protein [Metabacillus halosaccharovorans]|uniref:magnesium transporter CorA family protein n=1 Tax=Bacillaceae TaxID=186817 RepID=UPI000479CD1B|nr:magnesium transporter CorA family protein [Bacillus sp. J37]